MALPTLATFYAGQRWRAADVNSQIRDAATFAYTAKSCRATSAGTPSIPDATWTALTLGSESFDTDGWHSTSSNTDRITPTLAGIYRVEIQVAFEPDPAGMRGVRILKNGSTKVGGVQLPASPAGTMTLLYAATTMNANGTTDYFSTECYQTSGAGLDLETSETATTFTVTWIGA